MNFPKIKSSVPRNALIRTTITSTMPVNLLASLRVGQFTRRNSVSVSRKYRTIPLLRFLFGAVFFFATYLSPQTKRRRPKDRRRFRQARQESNPQQPVLETGALPIELLAYYAGSYSNPILSLYAVCVSGTAYNIYSAQDGRDHYDDSSASYNSFPDTQYIPMLLPVEHPSLPCVCLSGIR